MVSLNCLLYEHEPTLTCIIPVEVNLSETIGVLREKIWEKYPEWKTTINVDRLVVYTPKTPISTASEEIFNGTLKNLNLGTAEGRDLVLDQLNVTSYVKDYPSLKEAAKNQLHVIAFVLEGWSRLYYLSRCYLLIIYPL